MSSGYALVGEVRGDGPPTQGTRHGSATEQAVDESAMLIGLKKLFVLAEAYPELKAEPLLVSRRVPAWKSRSARSLTESWSA